MIGILEEDLQDAVELLQENNDKSRPLIVELSKFKVQF